MFYWHGNFQPDDQEPEPEKKAEWPLMPSNGSFIFSLDDGSSLVIPLSKNPFSQGSQQSSQPHTQQPPQHPSMPEANIRLLRSMSIALEPYLRSACLVLENEVVPPNDRQAALRASSQPPLTVGALLDEKQIAKMIFMLQQVLRDIQQLPV